MSLHHRFFFMEFAFQKATKNVGSYSLQYNEDGALVIPPDVLSGEDLMASRLSLMATCFFSDFVDEKKRRKVLESTLLLSEANFSKSLNGIPLLVVSRKKSDPFLYRFTSAIFLLLHFRW